LRQVDLMDSRLRGRPKSPVRTVARLCHESN